MLLYYRPIYRSPITDHHFPGGVAERLIAPVLKTGRPKGLVSSNLTPSATFHFEVLAQTGPKSITYRITKPPKFVLVRPYSDRHGGFVLAVSCSTVEF